VSIGRRLTCESGWAVRQRLRLVATYPTQRDSASGRDHRTVGSGRSLPGKWSGRTLHHANRFAVITGYPLSGLLAYARARPVASMNLTSARPADQAVIDRVPAASLTDAVGPAQQSKFGHAGTTG
jgi:hypothetical protein